jgi:hypothetical protein
MSDTFGNEQAGTWRAWNFMGVVEIDGTGPFSACGMAIVLPHQT